jgi:hypothetical protein
VRDVRGYEYAVINDHALFPFRYADRPRPLDRARLPANASPTRHRLLRAHGPQPPGGLFDVDEDLVTEEYLGLRETFEELGASTRLVCVFFTADAENDIHAIHWGTPTSNPTAPSRGPKGNSSRSLPYSWSDGRGRRCLDTVGRGADRVLGRPWAVRGRPTLTVDAHG